MIFIPDRQFSEYSINDNHYMSYNKSSMS